MALLAVAVLFTGLLGATSAQASRSVSSSSRTIGASGILTLNNDRIICEVLLQLVLTQNPIAKTVGNTFGYAQLGYIRNCTGPFAAAAPNNTGTILSGSPVGTLTQLQYVSFSGNLPSPTAINVQSANAQFVVNTIAGPCLYGANASNLLTGVSITASGGSPNVATGAAFTNDAIPRVSGSLSCPTTGAISGTLRVLGTAPTLTLL
jgi:hypothetical protein